jgi:hypothetical protein
MEIGNRMLMTFLESARRDLNDAAFEGRLLQGLREVLKYVPAGEDDLRGDILEAIFREEHGSEETLHFVQGRLRDAENVFHRRRWTGWGRRVANVG